MFYKESIYIRVGLISFGSIVKNDFIYVLQCSLDTFD